MDLPLNLGEEAMTNNKLVDNLVKEGIINTDTVEKVMKEVDRGEFWVNSGSLAYLDWAQSIHYGATISAPHMHATALE